MDTKSKVNIVAPEVSVQKQPMIVRCPNCYLDIKISKVCPKCKRAYEKESNYCGNCGAKLTDTI